MFCQNCGNQLTEGAAFCGQCGAKVAEPAAPQQPTYEAPQSAPQPAYEAPQPAYEAPQPAYEAPQPAYSAPQTSYTVPQPAPVVAPARPQEDPELNELAKSTMIMGIIGLALSELGLPGLIISNIAMNKAAEFESKAGGLFGKAKVGRRLAKPGKIVGLIMTIFWAVYIFFLIVTILSGM